MGARAAVLLALLLGPVLAQDAEEEGCTVIEVGGDASETGTYDVEVDPFPDPAEQVEEPNRPPPIQVGEWEPPELDPEAAAELQALRARRAEQPDDAGIRYRLADFLLGKGWYPDAELELLRCAELERDSIRPWEALVRLYRAEPQPPAEQDGWIQVGNGVVVNLRDGSTVRQESWIPSEQDRNARITRAYEELLARRPDDVARRRELLDHLTATGSHRKVVEHARLVLAQLPGDARTRYDLAEALRRDPATFDEAVALLEENAARAPEHAASALRLARMLAVRDGTKAADRIHELQKRAFFHLFVRSDLAPVAYREDVFRMARDLAGKAIADRLWDDALRPPRAPRDALAWLDGRSEPYVVRWIGDFRFPKSLPEDRIGVIRALGRRGDEGAAAMLVSFLWHLEDFGTFDVDRLVDRGHAASAEGEALAAAGGLGSACFAAAERFLRAAPDPVRRRRAVYLLRLLGDARAVPSLLEALARETDADASLGVAAALEDLRDPRAVDGLVEAAMDARRPAARRREAAEALAVFKDPRALEALNRLLREPEFGLVASYGLFRLTGDVKAVEELRRQLREGGQDGELLRLVAKCEDPRVEELLLDGVASTRDPAVRARAVAQLRERFWEGAGPRVKAIFLEEALSAAVSDLAVQELGRMGGEDAADRLLALLENAPGERFEVFARALAETGDPRAVRHFSRMKILEKDPDRRRLAAELHGVAAKRQAEIERARSGE